MGCCAGKIYYNKKNFWHLLLILNSKEIIIIDL